jgi:hypothetical protein
VLLKGSEKLPYLALHFETEGKKQGMTKAQPVRQHPEGHARQGIPIPETVIPGSYASYKGQSA